MKKENRPPKSTPAAHWKTLFPPVFWRLLLVLAALAALALLLVLLFRRDLLARMYLFWNLLLAGLPVLFSSLALWRRYAAGRWGPGATLFSLLWLAFFPNAPYMLTDLVHLRLYSFSPQDDPYSYTFTAQPEVWVGFLHIVLPVAAGCTLGFLSLYLMHTLVRRQLGQPAGWLFCLAACLLGGFGIYLGRCLRFNSWDLLRRPTGLLSALLQQFSVAALLTCLLFSLMTLALYLLFYTCYHRKTLC
ncbi:DUF1361 domain-containing protein [Ruminococcaceae bacterium OttesenSCG-928-I18]|nr:DUF1361 domain-containing protein [Ruminococcaceae bacterium OttesenSCG-928-I18]